MSWRDLIEHLERQVVVVWVRDPDEPHGMRVEFLL